MSFSEKQVKQPLVYVQHGILLSYKNKLANDKHNKLMIHEAMWVNF